MSEHVKPALDAAANAIMANLKDRRGIRQEIEQCDADVQAEIGKTLAAIAVAAFHRALPTASVMLAAERGRWFNTETLADAVEAAGKDQGND